MFVACFIAVGLVSEIWFDFGYLFLGVLVIVVSALVVFCLT